MWVLLALSPLFAGFLYLPWRECRTYGAPRLRLGAWVAIGLVAALFGAMAITAWANPLAAWLATGDSSARHRMLPAIWALFSMPLWGVSILLFRRAAQDAISLVSTAVASGTHLRVLGGSMIGLAWLIFVVLSV